MPGTIRLLRISVLLPVVSIFALGLMRPWHDLGLPDAFVILVVVLAILPASMALPAYWRRRLAQAYLPIALATYLICQSVLSSLLHNLGLVRFDLVQLGPVFVLEPGVLLILPPLLIAWQYGWVGALLASAAAGTLHLGVGLLLHMVAPEATQHVPVTPMLRPDLLYFLPLIVAYLSSLWRRHQKLQVEAQHQLREYAATAEVLAAGRERNRLADLLQNTVGRSLVALNEQLDGLGTALGVVPEATAERLALAQAQVRDDVQRTQEVIADLRARPLYELGLVEAIRARAESLARRHKIEVDVQVNSPPSGLTEEQELIVYHVAEQALNHVETHTDVHHVGLHLTCLEQHVALTIHDDGHCQCRGNGSQMALEDVEACASLVGGHLRVDVSQEHGNTVALWMPCGRPE